MPADPRPNDWQGFWETPRNLALIGAALAGIIAVLTGAAGVLGFKLGQRDSVGPQPMQIVLQPGAIVVTQPVAASVGTAR